MKNLFMVDLNDPKDFKVVRVVEVMLLSAARIRRHCPLVILVGESVGVGNLMLAIMRYDERIIIAYIVRYRLVG